MRDDIIIEIEESETRRDELRARVMQLVANAIQALGTTGQAVNLTRVQVEASHNALRLVETAYTEGAGSILDEF